MFKGLGGLGDMGKMMKAAQETQEKMVRMQEDLAYIEVIGESGAGLVKATATAKGEQWRTTFSPRRDDRLLQAPAPACDSTMTYL